jgi:colanic acid/amylovoran biosynthesis glycosyltransferase
MSRLTSRVGYLIGQFPAINHHYLLLEIRHLRAAGIDVPIASIKEPDRPVTELEPDEQALVPEIYCVKRTSPLTVAALAGVALFQRPIRFLAALRRARSLARTQNLNWRYGWYYLAEAVLVARWLRRHEIGHLHASFTSTVALIVKVLCGAPMSFGVYGFGELYDPVGTQLSLKIREALFVRSVSQHGVAQLMLASPPDQWSKFRYLRLGIEPECFRPRTSAPSSGFELICVGRLAPEKGHRFLIAAMERLTSRGYQATLRLVGDGPDRQSLEADVAQRGLGGRVLFDGWVSQERLDALYSSASACVLGSLYEGTPIVLMEAMVREIACVAPAVGGIPELIVHEKTGLLFTAGDVEELSRRIASLLDSPEYAHQLGRAARSLVLDRYDIVRNTRELAEMFQSVTPPLT